MDNMELMEYWERSSDEDYEVMLYLHEGGKNTYSLFFGHLVIEKLLKGLYAKQNKDSPIVAKTHNLLALAEKCGLDLDEDQVGKLQTITQFNISARYDDYKNAFYLKCTDEYAASQIKNIEETRGWLKGLLTEQ